MLKIQINTKKTVEKDKKKQQKVKDAQIRSIYGIEKRCCNKIQNTESDFCCQKKKLDFHNMQIGKDNAWYKREIYIFYTSVYQVQY